MKVFERYFGRNLLQVQPEFRHDPDVIVIIPVLNDRDIFGTLDSLYRCSCREGKVGVIVVVNHSEKAEEEVKQADLQLLEELREYVKEKETAEPDLSVVVVAAFDLPVKYAGVGLARKIAMDAAAACFYRTGKPEAPIVSLDADTWVDENYTDAVLGFFRQHAVSGVSIAYEHRLEDCRGSEREAMVKYELYLRYYRLALAYTGHPYAYPCIGSAFAVRAVDYVAQGGMNRRQAGEDFYFIQKLIGTGRFAMLQTTRVYPSPRISGRTPFGTGKAVKSIAEQGGRYDTYSLEAFTALKFLFQGIGCLFRKERQMITDYFARQAPGVQDYLLENGFTDIVAEVSANCASEKQFIKRFFDRFNAFRVLKYLNEVHVKYYRKKEVAGEVRALARLLGWKLPEEPENMLYFLREHDLPEIAVPDKPCF